MTNASKPTVLVIDQYEQASLTIKVYGDTAVQGWSTEVITSVADLEQLTARPDLVLLHIGDGSHWRPDEMLAQLANRRWTGQTVLVTGKHTQDIVASLLEMQRKHALRAVIPRPVDFGLIEAWLSNKTPTPSVSSKPSSSRWAPWSLKLGGVVPWAEYADQLEPAVVVFSTTESNKIPKIEWQNKRSKDVNEGKLTDADQRRITLLQANLAEDLAEGKPARRAKCLDWDVQTKQWVECRLHPLEGSTFWYTAIGGAPRQLTKSLHTSRTSASCSAALTVCVTTWQNAGPSPVCAFTR